MPRWRLAPSSPAPRSASPSGRWEHRDDPHAQGGQASAVKARTQSLNQIKALLVTAPADCVSPSAVCRPRACSTVVPRSVPVCSTHRRRRRRSRCAAWPVATSRSGTRPRSWTWRSGGSWPARRPGCSPRSAWVLTVRRPCSSAPGTTPGGCVPRPPSPPSVDRAPPGLVGQDDATPPQPRRGPSSQRRPVPHRRGPSSLAPADPGLHGPPHRRGKTKAEVMRCLKRYVARDSSVC